MQPLQYDLQCPAAKDNNISHAAAAASSLDATITMRSAETDLRNAKEQRARMSAKQSLNRPFHCDLLRNTIEVGAGTLAK